MSASESGFGLQHLPYGVFSAGDGPRIGVRFGDQVLDAGAALAHHDVLNATVLNPLMAAGPETWAAVRADLQDFLGAKPDSDLLRPVDSVELLMPFEVADYVDFYASENHAANLGRLFRPDTEPLLPNWKHLPVGYHGRAGTVVVSGTDIVRPSGQRKGPNDPAPTFGPSQRLDIEAEVGFVVGVGSQLGKPVPATDFAAHVFGVCLVNDWSARDIQAWEYVPLGPFLGKSFATSISAWITPLAALEAARVQAPPRDVPVLDYLQAGGDWGLDLTIDVAWNGVPVSRPPFAGMYWTAAQMMAHMTVNGATLRTGDLFASGTVSGTEPGSEGSFIEQTLGWKQPIDVAGERRIALEDGDSVTIAATANGAGGELVHLGEVTGRIVPA